MDSLTPPLLTDVRQDPFAILKPKRNALMRFSTCASFLIATIAMSLISGEALAQQDPWNTYTDATNVSRCAVINAANAELVVSSVTGQLVLVSATDVTLEDTFVDADNFVFFEGESIGSIGFAADGDGLLSLWWLTLTGTVVEIDSLTAVPSATDETPSDFTDAGCDACDFWDDPSPCEEPTITVPLCGVDVPVTLPMIGLGLGVMGFVQPGGRGRRNGAARLGRWGRSRV